MTRHALATFLVSLLAAACVSERPMPERPTRFANSSIEEVRAAVRDPQPDCVQPFLECASTSDCNIRIAKNEWDEAKRAQWAACDEEFVRWIHRRGEAMDELAKRIPLPRCAKFSRKLYEKYDIGSHVPERDLLLISKGIPISDSCLQKNCAWVAENIPGLSLVADRCRELKQRRQRYSELSPNKSSALDVRRQSSL